MIIIAAIMLKKVDTIPLSTPDVSAERATGKLPKKEQSPSSTQSTPFSTGRGMSVYMFITEITEITIAIKITVNAEPLIIPLILVHSFCIYYVISFI